MCGEGPTFRCLHARRVDEQVGRYRAAQAVAEAVGHRVVDGHVVGVRDNRGIAHEIRCPAGEGGCDRQSRGVHVVFHVVLGRVRQHDPGTRPPHDRRDPPQQPFLVEDQQVGGEALVKLRAQDARRRAGLTGPGATGLLPRHRHAAAVAVGDVEIVDRPAGVAEQEERASGVELDVVRVGDDRECGRPLVMVWWRGCHLGCRLGFRLGCCQRVFFSGEMSFILALSSGLFASGCGGGRSERREGRCQSNRPVVVADRARAAICRGRQRRIQGRREADAKGFVSLRYAVADHEHGDRASGLPRGECQAAGSGDIVTASCRRPDGRGENRIVAIGRRQRFVHAMQLRKVAPRRGAVPATPVPAVHGCRPTRARCRRWLVCRRSPDRPWSPMCSPPAARRWM